MLTMAKAVLQIKYPNGGVKSSHYQTEELSVTKT